MKIMLSLYRTQYILHLSQFVALYNLTATYRLLYYGLCTMKTDLNSVAPEMLRFLQLWNNVTYIYIYIEVNAIYIYI